MAPASGDARNAASAERSIEGWHSYEEFETDVLIIGAGTGGLRAATELDENGVTCLALGTLDPDDREIHVAATIREGRFVCDPRAVELLAKHTPDQVLICSSRETMKVEKLYSEPNAGRGGRGEV